MALPEDERAAAIARIGEWYGQHTRAGHITLRGGGSEGGVTATTGAWGQRDTAGSRW